MERVQLFDDSLDGIFYVILTLDTCSGWHTLEEMMDELQLTEDFRQQVYINRSTPEEQFAEIQENIKIDQFSFSRKMD